MRKLESKMWAKLAVFLLCSVSLGHHEAWAIPFSMDLSTEPQVITPRDEIVATFEFGTEGMFGFNWRSTYDIDVSRNLDEIAISIVAISPPPLGPGEVELQGFLSPVFRVPIGNFAPGDYRLSASLILQDAEIQPIGYGNSVFSVVPEPSAAGLAVMGWVALATGMRVRCRKFAAGERRR
jgi:hypothetical protein